MAGLTIAYMQKWLETASYKDIAHGENAIPYDKAGVMLSFISKRRWWNPSNKRNWCNESCAIKLMAAWPGLLVADKAFSGKFYDAPIAAFLLKNPHELTPDQTEYLIANYFDRERKEANR